MTPPSGGTTISGISNKTGTEMGNSTTYDNTWGYGWGATSTSDANLTYRALSTTGTNLLTVNGTSDKPALSNRAVDFTRKLVFAVKFGEEAVAGRYYANVTLSLTATPATLTTYSVTYDCKSGTGCPVNYSESLYDESKTYTIPSTTTNNPTRAGYNFLGYSTNSNATTADSNYAPGTTITLTQASSTRTLYAVWRSSFNGITNMQQMTATICKNATIGDTATLTDTRNKSTYTIRKHEDGNCWMTKNLYILNKTITSADSNVTSDYAVPASDVSKFLYSNTAAYASGTSGYGVHYSYTVATANAASTSSICPKEWRLPSRSDYEELLVAIGASNDAAGSELVRNDTYKFQLAGYVVYSYSNAGSAGRYWTRTEDGGNGVGAYRFLSLTTDSVTVSADSYGSGGYSVRCVAYSS